MKKLRRQKPKSAGKAGSLNKKTLIFIGLALLVGYRYMTRDSVPEQQAPTMAAKESVPEPPPTYPIATPPPVVISEKTEIQTPERIDKLRARSFLNRELGIDTLKLDVVDGTVKIPFVFTPEKRWCQGGDLDTITFMETDRNSPEFLISIEALTGKQRGDKMRISANGLFAGFEKTFEVVVRKSTESFGLYICRDSARTNSCRGKTLATHNEISTLLADSKTAPQAQKTDYQIYFLNFIIKDGVLLTYDNKDIGKERTNKLKKHLNEEYGVQNPDFTAAWEVTKVLRSVPAKIADNKITLSLPYNDPRCEPGGSSLPPE